MLRSPDQLPEPLRARLLEIGAGARPAGHVVSKAESWFPKLIAIAIGVAAIAIAVRHAMTWGYPLRTGDEVWAHEGPIAGGILFIIVGLARAVGLARSRQKPVAVTVPGFHLLTGRDSDPVWFVSTSRGTPDPEYAAWYDALGKLPEARARSPLGKLVKLALAAAASAGLAAVVFPSLWVENVRIAERLAWEESERGTWTEKGMVHDAKAWEKYVEWQRWFVRVPPAIRSRTDLDAHLAEAEAKVDDLSFAETKTAAEVRAYRKKFPTARHLPDAAAKLHAIYADAEKSYLARAGAGDARAVEGMKALLAFLCDSDDPTVRIEFLPVAGLEGAEVEKAARELTGSDKVQEIGPSFTPERNRMRETEIARAMQTAFARVFPGDVFLLDVESKKKLGPRFLVRYRVLGSGAIYTWNEEEKLPIAQRRIYPGIAIAFDFTLQVPTLAAELADDPEKGYRFSMVVKPLPNFSVAGQSPTARDVYDRMAGTAFSQFEDALARAYGVGK